MITLNHKGYARFITDSEENVERIKEIIKDMDDFEYEYMPKDIFFVIDKESLIYVTPNSRFPAFDELLDVVLVYNGKFDNLDLDELHRRCREKDIMFTFLSGSSTELKWKGYMLDENSLRTAIGWLYEDGYVSKDDVLRTYDLEFLIDNNECVRKVFLYQFIAHVEFLTGDKDKIPFLVRAYSEGEARRKLEDYINKGLSGFKIKNLDYLEITSSSSFIE